MGMGAFRKANVFARAAMAVVFGFMSLVHSPVMAFAKDMRAHHASSSQSHAHHDLSQRHARYEHQLLPPSEEEIPVCNGIGCFLVVFPASVIAPEVQLIVLGKLAPGSPHSLRSTPPGSLDPPPRLQA
jgi:hypothetical protein